jgi:hypothetical protein
MSTSIGERVSLFVRALSAVGFLAGGIWGGATVWGDTLFWLTMRHAVQIPGRLLAVSDKGNEGVVPAVTYRYDFRGRTFTGNRAVVHEDAYNFQDFPRSEFPWALRRRLQDTYKKGEVTVYVNSDIPSMSTLDRSFHFDAMIGPLLIFLGGIAAGLACGYGFYREIIVRNRGKAAEQPESGVGR